MAEPTPKEIELARSLVRCSIAEIAKGIARHREEERAAQREEDAGVYLVAEGYEPDEVAAIIAKVRAGKNAVFAHVANVVRAILGAGL